MDGPLPAILAGLILPVGAYVLCRWMLVLCLPARSTLRPERWAEAVAVAAGYTAGHVVILGWPAWPITSVAHYMIPVALLAGIVGVLDGATRWPWTVRGGIHLMLFAGIFLLLFGRFIRTNQTVAMTALWLALIPMLLTTGTLLWSSSTQRLPRGASGVMLAIPIFALTFAQKNASSGLYAQLTGIAVSLSMMLAVTEFLVRRRQPDLEDRIYRGSSAVIVVIVSSLTLAGCYYSDLPVLAATLMALAPLSGCLLTLLLPRPGSFWLRWLQALTPVIALTLIGAYLARPTASASPY